MLYIDMQSEIYFGHYPTHASRHNMAAISKLVYLVTNQLASRWALTNPAVTFQLFQMEYLVECLSNDLDEQRSKDEGRPPCSQTCMKWVSPCATNSAYSATVNRKKANPWPQLTPSIKQLGKLDNWTHPWCSWRWMVVIAVKYKGLWNCLGNVLTELTELCAYPDTLKKVRL